MAIDPNKITRNQIIPCKSTIYLKQIKTCDYIRPKVHNNMKWKLHVTERHQSPYVKNPKFAASIHSRPAAPRRPVRTQGRMSAYQGSSHLACVTSPWLPRDTRFLSVPLSLNTLQFRKLNNLNDLETTWEIYSFIVITVCVMVWPRCIVGITVKCIMVIKWRLFHDRITNATTRRPVDINSAFVGAGNEIAIYCQTRD